MSGGRDDSIDLTRLLLVLLAVLCLVLCFKAHAAAQDRRPVLAVWSAQKFANGRSACPPCDHFWHDYQQNARFRAALDSAFRVVYVNFDQHKLRGTLLRGVTAKPTFIVQNGPRVVGYGDGRDGTPAHILLMRQLGVDWLPVSEPPRTTQPARTPREKWFPNLPPPVGTPQPRPEQPATPAVSPRITPDNRPFADSDPNVTRSELEAVVSSLRDQIRTSETADNVTQLEQRLDTLEGTLSQIVDQAPVSAEALESLATALRAEQSRTTATVADQLAALESAACRCSPQATTAVPRQTAPPSAEPATTADDDSGDSWIALALRTAGGALWGPPGAIAAMALTGLGGWWFKSQKSQPEPAVPASTLSAVQPTDTVYSRPPEDRNTATVNVETRVDPACERCVSLLSMNSNLSAQLRRANIRVDELTADLERARQAPSAPHTHQVISVDTGLELARRAIDMIWRSEGAANPSFARWKKLFDDHVRLLQSGEHTGD